LWNAADGTALVCGDAADGGSVSGSDTTDVGCATTAGSVGASVAGAVAGTTAGRALLDVGALVAPPLIPLWAALPEPVCGAAGDAAGAAGAASAAGVAASLTIADACATAAV
jgi:hypothetical protein